MNPIKAWLPLLKMALAAMMFFAAAIPSCSVINDRLDEQGAAQSAMIEAHKADNQDHWNKDNDDENLY